MKYSSGLVVKAMKTGSGLWAVFWGTEIGTEGKATKLAYQRWFKDESTAQKWADKFAKKLDHA